MSPTFLSTCRPSRSRHVTITALLISLLLCLELVGVGLGVGVQASSAPARPLKRIAHPTTLALEIVPRHPGPAHANSNKLRPSKRTDTNSSYPSSSSSNSLDSSSSPILLHSDTFRLTIAAFDDIFYLHLRPNDHLIHPAARIRYYRNEPQAATNGQGKTVTNTILYRTTPLLRSSVRVYWGEVFSARDTEARLREDAAGVVVPGPEGRGERGWARVVVHDQGGVGGWDEHSYGMDGMDEGALDGMDEGATGGMDGGRRPPVYEGAFAVDGVVHHVMTRGNYERNRGVLDPRIEVQLQELDLDVEGLVIWRDVDVMSREEEEAAAARGVGGTGNFNLHGLAKAGGEGGSQTGAHRCSHDDLAFNTDPALNPILRPQVPLQGSLQGSMTGGGGVSWYNPLNMFETLAPGPWANLSGSTSSRNWKSGQKWKRDDIAGGSGSNNYASTIGDTQGCPMDQRVVYMGVAADCMYTSQYGSTQQATTQILNDFNSASALYKTTFNVSLGIIHIEVHDSECPSSPDPTRPWNTGCSNVTLNDRLSLFSAWRGTLGNDGTGLWHLMSGCPTGTEVGVAWLGTLCQQDASGSNPSVVSGTAVTTNGRTEWQVVSHEIGHNFGAIHDCESGCNSTSPCCPLNSNSCDASDDFIMAPVTGTNQNKFSQCSIGNICSLMLASTSNHLNDTCIQVPNPTQQTISLQMCGNGIVESGEDCDPGLNAHSSCCDSTTCKFTAGAVCDPMSGGCCTAQCGFANATTVCRASIDAQCDTPEFCTGTSAACPANVFSPNGQSCGPNGLACASGQCTSETLQCQTVGASMHLTQACPQSDSTSCLVSCQDPNNSNQCIQLQTQLVDGTGCGLGGTCSQGVCQAGSALDTAAAWYKQNLQIAIPVTIIAALVFLLLIYLIVMAIRRKCCVAPRKVTDSPRPKPTNVLSRNTTRRLSNWNPLPSNSNIMEQIATPPATAQPAVREHRKHNRNHTVASVSPSAAAFPSYHTGEQSPRNRSWDGQYGAYSPGFSPFDTPPPQAQSSRSPPPSAPPLRRTSKRVPPMTRTPSRDRAAGGQYSNITPPTAPPAVYSTRTPMPDSSSGSRHQSRSRSQHRRPSGSGSQQQQPPASAGAPVFTPGYSPSPSYNNAQASSSRSPPSAFSPPPVGVRAPRTPRTAGDVPSALLPGRRPSNTWVDPTAYNGPQTRW